MSLLEGWHMANQCCVMRCEYISYQTSVCYLTLHVGNAQHTALAVRRHSGSSWHASVGKPYRTGFSAVRRKRPPEREKLRERERATVCSLCHLQKKHLGLLQPYIAQCPDTMSALIPDRARQRDRESERAVKQRQRERNRPRE